MLTCCLADMLKPLDIPDGTRLHAGQGKVSILHPGNPRPVETESIGRSYKRRQRKPAPTDGGKDKK